VTAADPTSTVAAAQMRRDAPRNFGVVFVGLCALLAAAMIVVSGIGAYPLSPPVIIEAIYARLTGQPIDTTVATVLFNIRLPRVMASGLVGAGLAGAGAAYQSTFRNPLVSPDILGVSTGASLGAVLGIFLALPVLLIQLMGFIGGMLTVGLVMLLASAIRGGGKILVLILSGIVVGALGTSAISLLKVLADPYDQLPTITFFLLGSLARVTGGDVMIVLPIVALGVLPLVLFRWQIGVLSLGDDEARTLGVNARLLRLVVISAATLMTSAVVAISGTIGWVGLMVPHIGRFIVGPRFDRLLPVSLVLGALFMVVVDTLARTVGVIEVPLGILTAVVGAPLFVWLLARGRHSWVS
jgi:iron complex transport system permease protein